jgi:hypothetical protein
MFHRKAWRSDLAQQLRRIRLRVEELEARIVPYNVTGNAWPHPELITLSFVPDGTIIGYNENGPIGSTLFADFNAKFGSPATWEKQIELAAQVWAKATNINFAVVADDGDDYGTITGHYQQGDPLEGDIRIGGFQDTGASYLGQAYQPPPENNYSIAGDIWFNTSQAFHIGTTYDLFTVASHEIGHALGMDHSGDSTAVMAPIYPGTRTDLMTDDTNGIRSIYSAGAPRAYDAYNNGSTHNNSFTNAASFTVNPTKLTAQLTNLDITTVGMNEYYKFVAPVGSLALKLSIQSRGLSLLSPRVYVYDSTQTPIASASGAGTYGATVNLSVVVLPLQTYYIRVLGTESTALGTGKYALSLSTGLNSIPSVRLPYTTTANGNPISDGGSSPEGDQYVASTDDLVGMEGPPGSTPPAVGLLQIGAQHMLGDDAWVLHHAQLNLSGPHALTLNTGVGNVDGDDAAAEEMAAGVVPEMFPDR